MKIWWKKEKPNIVKLRNQNSKLETKTCRKQKEFAKEREPVELDVSLKKHERNCESIGCSRSAKWRPRKKQKLSAKR